MSEYSATYPTQPYPGPRRNRLESAPLLLENALAQFMPLPPLQMLLGLCEDGLPLLFDLSEPDSGALLFLADSDLVNAVAIKATLAAACRMNYPEALSLSLISPRPRYYASLEYEPHLKLNFHSQSAEAGILIEEFCNLAEERGQGESRHPVQILALDGLDTILTDMSPDHQALLAWLAENGPLVGIWVFAGLCSAGAGAIDPAWLELFPTRLLGPLQTSPASLPIGSRLARHLASLEGGFAAVVLVETQALGLRLALAETQDASLLDFQPRPWTPLDEALSHFPEV